MVQAQRMPSRENSARNLLLNQRVSTDAPFVSPDVWTANGAKPVPFEGPVFACLDLSARHDLTALVLAGKVARACQVFLHFWTLAQGSVEGANRHRHPCDVWDREGLPLP